MKVSCEVCRKTFKVEEGKLSSRGTTFYCPRCKHPHLVKRVVEPYPVEGEFHHSPKGAEERALDSMTQMEGRNRQPLGVFVKGTGDLHLKPEDSGSHHNHRPEKKTYHWKEYLKKYKKRRIPGTGSSGGFFKTLFQILIILVLLGGVVGYLYFQTLSPSERQLRVDWAQRWLDYLRNMH